MMPDTEERKHQLISQVKVLEHGIALFNHIGDRITIINEKPKKINTEDIKSDLRYNIGYIDALEWVLKQPEEAQEILNNAEGV